MKKLTIFLSILFLTGTVYAQQKLKPVKLDSLVTVSLPAKFSKKDTLGQQIYAANSDMAYMVAIREPNAKGNQPLKKANDLEKVLKKYVKGIQAQTENGSAQNVRDTTIGKLKAKVFNLLTKDPNGENQNRNFVLLYTQDATYTFEYGYSDARKELVKAEAREFFSSIKLSSELQLNDQFTDTRSTKGISTKQIIEIAGGLLVVLLIIWLIFRKKNNGELA